MMWGSDIIWRYMSICYLMEIFLATLKLTREFTGIATITLHYITLHYITLPVLGNEFLICELQVTYCNIWYLCYTVFHNKNGLPLGMHMQENFNKEL
jgi:hypothetical protein